MDVAFVLDEHFRGTVFAAAVHHNLSGGQPIDITQVGDPPDLPRGSTDPDILIWAERNGRIVISNDRNTMIRDLSAHLAAGRTSPGVFMVRRWASIGQLIAVLELAAHAGEPADYADRVTFAP